jgi:nicotinamidase-related amidase
MGNRREFLKNAALMTTAGLGTADHSSVAGGSPPPERSRMSYGTYAFDNTRFFAPQSLGGKESGGDGWVKIAVKGRREYLSGIDPQRSALAIIDLQKGCAREWPSSIAKYDKNLGARFAQRMNEIAIPNVTQLLHLFREHDLPVIYTAIGQDEIIPEIAPDLNRHGRGGSGKGTLEFVIAKWSSGAFATSAFDNVLRELGVATIFFVGTDTCGCVDHTMSEAYDRSYQTILIEDACVGTFPELHEAVVKIWGYKGFVRTTAQVVQDYPWDSWVDPAVTYR